MSPDDLDKGLADLEQWLYAWITGREDTPGFVRRELLKAEGSEWLPSLGPIDEKETLEHMLAAVHAVQRIREDQRRAGSRP